MRPEIELVLGVLENGGRVAVVGASGSGKTSVMREVLYNHRKLGRRLIGYDPHGELGLPMCRTLGEVRAELMGPYGRAGVMDSELWAQAAELGLRAGWCTLVADEAQRLAPSTGRTTPALQVVLSICTEGRHAGVSWCWATQSPGRCHYALTDNTDCQVVGRLSAPSSISRVADWGVSREDLRGLPNHQLLLCYPGRVTLPFESRPFQNT